MRREECGISTIFGAIILLTIFMGAFSLFMVTAVPGMRAGKEFEHMQEVRKSFVRLKQIVEDLEEGEIKTIEFKMSPDPLPIFGGPDISGRLAVEENEDENRYGCLLFKIDNPDYVDQEWVYESGAVILCQPTTGGMENLMASPPAMLVAADNVGDNIRVDYHEVRVVGIEYSTSRAGYVSVDCSLSNEYYVEQPSGTQPNRENVVLRIFSDYTGAWLEYLQDLEARLLDKGYIATLDEENLQLIIDGKTTLPVNDIYYFHKITEIEIKIW